MGQAATNDAPSMRRVRVTMTDPPDQRRYGLSGRLS